MCFNRYLFFSGALQALCRRQEVLQYEVEQAQDGVKVRTHEKLRVQQGKTLFEIMLIEY